MEIKLVSFGFHHGIPKNLDVIIDARILRNPHRNKELRHLNGLHKAVQKDIWSRGAARSRLRSQGKEARDTGALGPRRRTIMVWP